MTKPKIIVIGEDSTMAEKFPGDVCALDSRLGEQFGAEVVSYWSAIEGLEALEELKRTNFQGVKAIIIQDRTPFLSGNEEVDDRLSGKYAELEKVYRHDGQNAGLHILRGLPPNIPPKRYLYTTVTSNHKPITPEDAQFMDGVIELDSSHFDKIIPFNNLRMQEAASFPTRDI